MPELYLQAVPNNPDLVNKVREYVDAIITNMYGTPDDRDKNQLKAEEGARFLNEYSKLFLSNYVWFPSSHNHGEIPQILKDIKHRVFGDLAFRPVVIDNGMLDVMTECYSTPLNDNERVIVCDHYRMTRWLLEHNGEVVFATVW